VQVFLGELDPEAVQLELYAESGDETPALHQPMTRQGQLAGSVNGYLYTATVPASRPADNYTPRLVPRFAGIATPLEAGEILWQK
jgi:glycogen phosphorylase